MVLKLSVTFFKKIFRQPPSVRPPIRETRNGLSAIEICGVFNKCV